MKKLCVLLIFWTCFGFGTSIQTYYMDQNCGKILDLSKTGLYQVRVRFTRFSTYHTNTDCDFFIRTGKSERLMTYFQSVETTSCSHAYIDVYNGNSTFSLRLVRKCGYQGSTSNVYSSSGNAMTLNFVSDSYVFVDKGFEMIITSYHNGECYAYEYECDNGRCIYDDLQCNGYNPCGDHTDCPLTGGEIAGIVIGCFFFVVIFFTVLVICRRRRRRGYKKTIVTETTSYGSATYGYNQPPTAYPTGQQYPPPATAPPPPMQYPQNDPPPYPNS